MSTLAYRLCGTAPDRPETRVRDVAARPWPTRTLGGAGTILQRVVPVRDQRVFPSCAGQSTAVALDAQHPASAPHVSGVSLWREARRRAGLPLDDLSRGTRFEDVLDGLEQRGWDPYRPGEDGDAEEAGHGATAAGDDLADELFAHDKRERVAERYRIWHPTIAGFLDTVDDALERGVGVVFGTGTRSPFYSLAPETTCGAEHLGGSKGGHGMRVVGRVLRDGMRVYVVQNSWGEGWGGCTVEGQFLAGHCFVAGLQIATAWDVYAVRVRG